jgi:ABC-type nitrate/sulfonate/bicarbonate transport system substrate-binding protein
VSVKFYKNNPKAVVGVYKALARAAKDIREDEASTKQYLPKYTPLDATLAQKCHLYFWWLPDDVDRGAVQKLANLFHEQGLLKTQIDTDKMFLSMEQKP